MPKADKMIGLEHLMPKYEPIKNQIDLKHLEPTDEKISDLEQQLQLLFKKRQQEKFQKILDNIMKHDHLKDLENKIFQLEYGCWLRDSQINDIYPDKIFAHVNDPITLYPNPEYYLLDRQVQSIPQADEVLKLHRFPNQICKLTIGGVATYRYQFSQKLAPEPKYGYDNNEYIYPILYYITKSIKDSIKP